MILIEVSNLKDIAVPIMIKNFLHQNYNLDQSSYSTNICHAAKDVYLKITSKIIYVFNFT